jgi:hypothetical protein
MKKKLMMAIFMLSTTAYGENKFSSEIGVGVNYGGLIGYATNYEVNPNTELFFGFGPGPGVLGFVLGGKYYINDSVRLIANYGTNSFAETSPGNWDSFQGVNFGVGYVGSKRDGWSIDLMHIDKSDAEAAMAGNNYSCLGCGSIKVSFGYRF